MADNNAVWTKAHYPEVLAPVVNRMQVQPTLPPIISDPVRHLP